MNMKTKLLKLTWLTLILALGFSFTSCEKSDEIADGKAILKSTSAVVVNACGSETFPLWAGQSIDAGNVIVQNSDEFIYVTINTTGDWLFQLSHLHIATSLSGIPANKQGIPVPGKFAYAASHDPKVSTFTYAIPNTFDEGKELFIAVHVEVVKLNELNEVIQGETAFGGNLKGSTSRWWYYLKYTVKKCEIDDEPKPCYKEETAWAGEETFGQPWYSYIVLDENQNASQWLWAGQHYNVGVVTVAPKAGDASKLVVKVELTGGSILQEGKDNFYIQGYKDAPEARPNSGHMSFKTIATGTAFEGEISSADVYFVAVHVNVLRPVECQ